MTCDVIWLQNALDELADIWTKCNSAVRKIVTKATNVIDFELRINPHEKGESRDGDERVFFA